MITDLADRLGTRWPAVAWAQVTGVPVVLEPLLSDGKIWLTNDWSRGGQMVLWIGTYADEMDRAARDARLMVRRGLADVLGWLGETVENEPTGAEIYAALLARAAT